MSDAEVMTTSIVAALSFSGNMKKFRVFLQEHGYIPYMSSKYAKEKPLQSLRCHHKIAELFWWFLTHLAT
jgi:hypothetical protein